MKRVVTVWWPDWPVVAAGATGRPAIVLRADRVVARSPAAAAEGVTIGQRRRVAQQRCPAAVLQPRRRQPAIHSVIDLSMSRESVTTQARLPAGRAASPSIAAVNSMRLFVV